MPAALDRTLAPWRRSSRSARWLAAGAFAASLLWGGALAVANRPAARARLRVAIRDALVRRLPGVQLGDSVAVDPLFRVSFGPLTLPADRRGAPPVVRAERVKVRASWGSLLAGRVEPASVRLYGVRVEPGERLGELRALAERLRGRPDPGQAAAEGARSRPRDWPAVHLRGAIVTLRHGGRAYDVGPLDLSLTRERDRESDELELTVSHREGGTFRAELHRGAGGFRLVASAVELGPELLPAPFADAPVRWSDGRISGDLSLSGRIGEVAKGRLRARLDRGEFSGERLAAEPVGPIGVELDAPLEADLTERRVAIRRGNLRALDAIDATLDAEGRIGPGLPFSIVLAVPAVDFGALSDALPPPLQPPRDAPRPTGPLSFRLGVSGPLRDPAAWAVEAGLDLAPLREAARRSPPVALRAPFTWRPEVETGEAPNIVIGPENPAFVPLAELPEHVVRAVTTSEDAGFFAHPGFDFEELRNAFAQGAEAGRVVRGASTITQQLAKNLFLSRERTLVRKAREAMVAIALEATVPKARLLEIYLNLAEWGPGLWGIGPAAQHYFGKAARALTPREAAFLASIIPNPIRYHGYYERGELDEAWTERLRVILLHMAEAGVLTEGQLVEALDAPLTFARSTADSGDGALPLAEPALEPLPGDGEDPPQGDHQGDAGDRRAE